jgi:hypothetical protein
VTFSDLHAYRQESAGLFGKIAEIMLKQDAFIDFE